MGETDPPGLLLGFSRGSAMGGARGENAFPKDFTKVKTLKIWGIFMHQRY